MGAPPRPLGPGGAPDAGALARFHARLLDWDITTEESGWAELRHPAGGVGISIHVEPDHTPPV